MDNKQVIRKSCDVTKDAMIYLDNNSTTPLDPAIVEAMLPYLRRSSEILQLPLMTGSRRRGRSNGRGRKWRISLAASHVLRALGISDELAR